MSGRGTQPWPGVEVLKQPALAQEAAVVVGYHRAHVAAESCAQLARAHVGDVYAGLA